MTYREFVRQMTMCGNTPVNAAGVPPLTLRRAKSAAIKSLSIAGNVKRTISLDGTEYVVPDGYTLLDYIQATGTNVIASSIYSINTGIAGSLDTEIETDITHIFIDSNELLSPISSANRSNSGISVSYYSSGPSWATRFGTVGWINQGTIVSGTKYHIVFNKDTFTVNGTAHALSATAQSDTSSIYLMSDIWTSAKATTTSLRMGTTIIRKSGTSVFIGVPAKNSSGTIGMYDFVTSTFFTNAGTGTFTAGNQLPMPDAPLEVKGVGDLVTESGSHYGKYKIPICVNSTTYDIFVDAPLLGNMEDDFGNIQSDILKDGKVTRKFKSLVLTGQEEWVEYDSNAYLCMLPDGNIDYMLLDTLCSHFRDSGTPSLYVSRNTVVVHGLTSLNDWCDFLAAQYAAGTPVTIWYLKKVATEEIVTMPTMMTGEGTNTVDVNTAVKPSNLKVKYIRK